METEQGVRVGGIDHVELLVTDRDEAAAWYERVLGLDVCREYRQWADVDGGPLMISSDGGETKLALFEDRDLRPADADEGRHHRVAFRVDGDGFHRFVSRLDELRLTDREGRRVSAADVVDHDLSFSVYFTDPYGNRLELTTYDHGAVAAALASADGGPA